MTKKVRKLSDQEPEEKQPLNFFNDSERFIRTLNITGSFAVFLGVVSLVQTIDELNGSILTSPSSNTLVFGLMSLLSGYLLRQKHQLAFMPLIIGILYPISYTLTTGQGLNIILIALGGYFLWRAIQLTRSDQ